MNETVFDLDDEKITIRENEFRSMSVEEKKILNEIMGVQNTTFISFERFMANAIQMIQEFDEDEECDNEISISFYNFINWYLKVKSEPKFYNKFDKNIKAFEEIINRGLEDEDENSIFKYANSETRRKFFGGDGENMPLSGLENEGLRRVNSIMTASINLIDLFENLESKQNLDWNTFEDILKTDESDLFDAFACF